MKSTLLILLFTTGSWIQTVAAQSQIEDDPGFVNFSDLDDLFGEDPIIEANIHGAILRLVAEAAELEDPELADLLRRVRGVYVRVFDLDRLDLGTVRSYKDKVSRMLVEDGWDTVIAVRKRDEEVNMYVRLVDEEIAGMVVMSINHYDDETAFLNIVGDIDPEQIGRIGRKFGVSGVSDF